MQTLRLNQIRRDGGTQSRAALDETAVSEYAEKMANGVEFPDMVVFYDGETYWMADGFHRAAAYERAGINAVVCDVRQGTKREAILYSVGANADHGVRRSDADKWRAVETLLRDDEWRLWSNRKIAKVAGVGHPFVGKVRGQVESDSTCEQPDTVRGSDGKQYPVTHQKSACDESKIPSESSGTELDRSPAEGNLDDDLPPPADAAITPEPEPASERRPVAREPEPDQEDDEPSQPLQACASAWNGMSEDEQDGFLAEVGAVRYSTLDALVEERRRDQEYSILRRLSDAPNATRGARMVTAVLDGADWALARLGLTWSSTEAEAKRAFRQASLEAHPDRGGSTEEFTAIGRANEIVMRWLQGRAA